MTENGYCTVLEADGPHGPFYGGRCERCDRDLRAEIARAEEDRAKLRSALARVTDVVYVQKLSLQLEACERGLRRLRRMVA